jgi:DNA-binding CsgD family transcriptional regulator
MTDRELLRVYGHVLTAKEREVFELSVRGLSQRAIALALGLHRSTVVSRMETGTKRFRDALREGETATRRLHQSQREEPA